MKVLYALQGTGNGHVARAREIVPILASRCDLDVLVEVPKVRLPWSILSDLRNLD